VTRLTPAQAVQRLAERLGGRGRVFTPGGPAEPLVLAEAYRAEPNAAARLTFVGAWIPGVNRTDWASLHPDARAETTFVSADWRGSFEARRLQFRPLSYGQTWTWLATTPLDAAILQVSPPDADGLCSLGTACDFAPAILERPMIRVAQVNAAVPAPPTAQKVPLGAFDIIVETEAPLAGYDAGALDPAFAHIAEIVAGLLPERATVEFGLGKAGVAVLSALARRKGDRIHSGMVTDPLLAVLDADAVESVTTGVALGSSALHARVASDPRVRFAPVSFTHDARVLAALPRFAAVNSALEVDLFGQANAEWQDGRQISGVGGLVDFLRGARLSPGGLPVLALAATARGGSVSRIVPRLSPGAVSVARADVGVVVTEYGAADLRTLDLDGRAEALVAIAAPQHRDALANAWEALRRAM
jgi:acyl-CoA hydrolase